MSQPGYLVSQLQGSTFVPLPGVHESLEAATDEAKLHYRRHMLVTAPREERAPPGGVTVRSFHDLEDPQGSTLKIFTATGREDGLIKEATYKIHEQVT